MKKLSNPLRFTLLLVAALALAFGLEVFCYAISYYDSENYEYEEVDLSLCTNAYGEYLSLDDGIVTIPARDSYEVYITDLCVGPSASVRFTFSGASLPLEFDVMLQDDSSTDSYAEAYTAYCVPGSASMSSVDCVVRSNGDLYGLCLKFPSSYEREQEVFLEAAEINPPAASFSVCAERFTVAFLLIFFLLFLFLFPWRSIYYQCRGTQPYAGSGHPHVGIDGALGLLFRAYASCAGWRYNARPMEGTDNGTGHLRFSQSLSPFDGVLCRRSIFAA